MNITERLRIELFIRQQLDRHGEEFYVELAKILDKIQQEQADLRGKPELALEKK